MTPTVPSVCTTLLPMACIPLYVPWYAPHHCMFHGMPTTGALTSVHVPAPVLVPYACSHPCNEDVVRGNQKQREHYGWSCVPIARDCVVVAWLLRGWYVAIAWLLCRLCMTMAWLLRGYCMAVVSLVHDYCVILAWLLRGYCASTHRRGCTCVCVAWLLRQWIRAPTATLHFACAWHRHWHRAAKPTLVYIL